jgi:hypothetical protein
MQALGQLSPVQRIEAEIQGKVAEFLGLKRKLVSLMNNPSLEIKSKAQGLYAVQQQLETQLQGALKTIESMKSGSWDFGQVVGLTDFSVRMLDQIKKVKELELQAGGVQVVKSDFFQTWVSFLMFGAGLLFVIGVLSKR